MEGGRLGNGLILRALNKHDQLIMAKDNRTDSVSLAYCSAELLVALEYVLPRDSGFECYGVDGSRTSPLLVISKC